MGELTVYGGAPKVGGLRPPFPDSLCTVHNPDNPWPVHRTHEGKEYADGLELLKSSVVVVDEVDEPGALGRLRSGVGRLVLWWRTRVGCLVIITKDASTAFLRRFAPLFGLPERSRPCTPGGASGRIRVSSLAKAWRLD